MKHQVSHSASAENIAADNFAVDVHLRMMTLGNHAANAANNHSHYLQQAAAQHNNAIRLVLFPIVFRCRWIKKPVLSQTEKSCVVSYFVGLILWPLGSSKL